MASIKNAKRLIKHVYRVYHVGDNAVGGHKRASPFLWGLAGVGKSECVDQVARELDIPCNNIRLSQMEPGDLTGLPVDKESDAMLDQQWEVFLAENSNLDIAEAVEQFQKAHGREMTWTRPPFMPGPNEPAGILFLDEFNRQTKLTLQASFELVLDGAVGIHKLPPNWMVVAAGNPVTEDDDDNYDVFDLDDASVDRFVHIKIEPDVREWLQYGSEQSYNQDVLAFIGSAPDNLGLKEPNFDLPTRPTPRSWEKVSQLLAGIPADLEYEMVQGLVGKEIGSAFISSRRTRDKPIPPEMILDQYPKVRKKIQKYAGDEVTNRADILKVTSDLLVGALRRMEKTGKDLTDDQGENMIKYLKDVPSDQAFGAIKDIVEIAHAHDQLMRDSELLEMLTARTKGIGKEMTGKL